MAPIQDRLVRGEPLVDPARMFSIANPQPPRLR